MINNKYLSYFTVFLAFQVMAETRTELHFQENSTLLLHHAQAYNLTGGVVESEPYSNISRILFPPDSPDSSTPTRFQLEVDQPLTVFWHHTQIINFESLPGMFTVSFPALFCDGGEIDVLKKSHIHYVVYYKDSSYCPNTEGEHFSMGNTVVFHADHPISTVENKGPEPDINEHNTTKIQLQRLNKPALSLILDDFFHSFPEKITLPDLLVDSTLTKSRYPFHSTMHLQQNISVYLLHVAADSGPTGNPNAIEMSSLVYQATSLEQLYEFFLQLLQNREDIKFKRFKKLFINESGKVDVQKIINFLTARGLLLKKENLILQFQEFNDFKAVPVKINKKKAASLPSSTVPSPSITSTPRPTRTRHPQATTPQEPVKTPTSAPPPQKPSEGYWYNPKNRPPRYSKK